MSRQELLFVAISECEAFPCAHSVVSAQPVCLKAQQHGEGRGKAKDRFLGLLWVTLVELNN